MLFYSSLLQHFAVIRDPIIDKLGVFIGKTKTEFYYSQAGEL